MGTEGTCTFRRDLGWSSRRFGHWSSLKFLLGHSLSSSGLLFLYCLVSVSAEVEIGRTSVSGDGAGHARNFPGQRLAAADPQVSAFVVPG